MLRAVILSLALLVGLGVVVPLATDYAEAGQKKQKKYKKQAKNKRYKKYSKAWWRAYRAKKKRQQMLARRKRALQLKQIRLARQRQEDIARNGGKWVIITTWNGEKWVSRNEWVAITSPTPTVPPPGENMAKREPKTKNRKEPPPAKNGSVEFKINDSNGSELGSASITVVGPAMSEENESVRSKSLSGVSTSSLRRTVIDQMIRENGWVVNDYQKQVGGKKVYVVVAQSPGTRGQVQSRLFYFAEVDGRIYSVATNSAVEASEQIADESEKIVDVLQRRSRGVQAGLR